jgi:hypothetical protein
MDDLVTHASVMRSLQVPAESTINDLCVYRASQGPSKMMLMRRPPFGFDVRRVTDA